MKFSETPLKGAFLIELEPQRDERGFFARSWCEREFAGRGLVSTLAQCNISYNSSSGTLRGLHFQVAPHAEAKLVRCTAGAIFDVIVDLRPDSTTYRHWHGLELAAGSRRMVYAPQGFAHGFQTLKDDTEVFYQMSHAYHAGSARGIRWDDPVVDVQWPLAHPIVSARDLAFDLIGK